MTSWRGCVRLKDGAQAVGMTTRGEPLKAPTHHLLGELLSRAPVRRFQESPAPLFRASGPSRHQHPLHHPVEPLPRQIDPIQHVGVELIHLIRLELLLGLCLSGSRPP